MELIDDPQSAPDLPIDWNLWYNRGWVQAKQGVDFNHAPEKFANRGRGFAARNNQAFSYRIIRSDEGVFVNFKIERWRPLGEVPAEGPATMMELVGGQWVPFTEV